MEPETTSSGSAASGPPLLKGLHAARRTRSGRALGVVLKHLNGLAHKEDLLGHPDGNVGGQHLCAQRELLQRRSQDVLLLHQPLWDTSATKNGVSAAPESK